MTTVKFDRSVKYNGVRYAAHEAFKVDDSDVAELRAAGATILAVETVNPPAPENAGKEGAEETAPETVENVAELKESLLSFTVAKLVEFAQDRNIDLQGKTRKADIYNIIVASLN